MKHFLKTYPRYYEDVVAGKKRFEVRQDDRGFQVGDSLLLQEYDPSKGYTGRRMEVDVVYKLPGGAFGILPNFCVLGIERKAS